VFPSLYRRDWIRRKIARNLRHFEWLFLLACALYFIWHIYSALQPGGGWS
jgi:hypothetical protein